MIKDRFLIPDTTRDRIFQRFPSDLVAESSMTFHFDAIRLPSLGCSKTSWWIIEQSRCRTEVVFSSSSEQKKWAIRGNFLSLFHPGKGELSSFEVESSAVELWSTNLAMTDLPSPGYPCSQKTLDPSPEAQNLKSSLSKSHVQVFSYLWEICVRRLW